LRLAGVANFIFDVHRRPIGLVEVGEKRAVQYPKNSNVSNMGEFPTISTQSEHFLS